MTDVTNTETAETKKPRKPSANWRALMIKAAEEVELKPLIDPTNGGGYQIQNKAGVVLNAESLATNDARGALAFLEGYAAGAMGPVVPR